MPADLQALEEKLEYTFTNRDLLVRALTHRSFCFDRKITDSADITDNEQLEFLGDSILGFLVSERLVSLHPEHHEGRLSKLKAHLVSAVRLHEVARGLELGEFLQLGRSEEMSGGRQKKALLADALEAVIAAMYLDGGIEPARRFVVSRMVADAGIQAALRDEEVNYKSSLQERAQAVQLPPPHYVIVEESGPGHARIFLVEARIGEAYTSRGSGPSKKAAAQLAAKAMLEQMNSATP